MIVWKLLGRIIGRLLRPFIGRYLKDSDRARLLVISGDKVLLVQDWLGSQSWSLPGGGIHSNESPQEAACRELHEETRIVIDPSAVTFHTIKNVVTNSGLVPYRAALCSVVVAEMPTPKPQRPELIDARWFDVSDLPSDIDYVALEMLSENQ